jgi:hypothetical protein
MAGRVSFPHGGKLEHPVGYLSKVPAATRTGAMPTASAGMPPVAVGRNEKKGEAPPSATAETTTGRVSGAADQVAFAVAAAPVALVSGLLSEPPRWRQASPGWVSLAHAETEARGVVTE